MRRPWIWVVALAACDGVVSPPVASRDAARFDDRPAASADDAAGEHSGDAEPPGADVAPGAGGAQADAPSQAPTDDAAPARDARLPSEDAGPPDRDGHADEPLSPEALRFQERLFAAEAVLQVSIALPEASEAVLLADPRADYVPADVTVDGVLLANVGLKLKGGRGSFRDLTQKAAFKIDVNRYVPGQTLAGLKKLTFNNMIQDGTQSRERLGSLAFHQLGLPAGRVGYVEITLNGTLYGLYSHVETIDEVFVGQNFPDDGGGNVYEGYDDLDLWIRDLADFDQDGGEAEDKLDLRGLILALDAATPADFEATVGARVDLDLARRFFAAEMLTGHWDGYAQLRNNYYLYSRPSDGRFVFLPWGMDQAFQRTTSALAGPGRLFRMCADWLSCRLAYAETLRQSVARLNAVDWVGEIDRLEILLAEPFSRDRKTPTRAAQRADDIAALRRWITDQPSRIEASLNCLDPALDADGDGTLSCAGDCDDQNPQIYPGAVDTCDNERDEDCSGFTDDGQDCPLCREAPVPGSETVFLVCHRPVRFSVANDLCLSMGATFASIHGEPEQRAVTEAAAERRLARWWIGAADNGSPGIYHWWDESAMDYEAWAVDQPDNNGGYEHCAALNAASDGAWADFYSGYYFPFLCRR